MDALLPQELQRDVPRPGGVGQKGGWADWVLGLKAPPRLKSKGWLTSASQACLSAAFVCVFTGSPGESGLVSRGSQGLRSPLESRRGSLGAP